MSGLQIYTKQRLEKLKHIYTEFPCGSYDMQGIKDLWSYG